MIVSFIVLLTCGTWGLLPISTCIVLVVCALCGVVGYSFTLFVSLCVLCPLLWLRAATSFFLLLSLFSASSPCPVSLDIVSSELLLLFSFWVHFCSFCNVHCYCLLHSLVYTFWTFFKFFLCCGCLWFFLDSCSTVFLLNPQLCSFSSLPLFLYLLSLSGFSFFYLLFTLLFSPFCRYLLLLWWSFLFLIFSFHVLIF